MYKCQAVRNVAWLLNCFSSDLSRYPFVRSQLAASTSSGRCCYNSGSTSPDRGLLRLLAGPCPCMDALTKQASKMSTPGASNEKPRRARGTPAVWLRTSCCLCASVLMTVMALMMLGSRPTSTSGIAFGSTRRSAAQQQPSWRLMCANSSSAQPTTTQLLQWIFTASSAQQAETGHILVERPQPTSQERSLSSAAFDAINGEPDDLSAWFLVQSTCQHSTICVWRLISVRQGGVQ